jgi:hypothetical protein
MKLERSESVHILGLEILHTHPDALIDTLRAVMDTQSNIGAILDDSCVRDSHPCSPVRRFLFIGASLQSVRKVHWRAWVSRRHRQTMHCQDSRPLWLQGACTTRVSKVIFPIKRKLDRCKVRLVSNGTFRVRRPVGSWTVSLCFVFKYSAVRR